MDLLNEQERQLLFHFKNQVDKSMQVKYCKIIIQIQQKKHQSQSPEVVRYSDVLDGRFSLKEVRNNLIRDTDISKSNDYDFYQRSSHPQDPQTHQQTNLQQLIHKQQETVQRNNIIQYPQKENTALNQNKQQIENDETSNNRRSLGNRMEVQPKTEANVTQQKDQQQQQQKFMNFTVKQALSDLSAEKKEKSYKKDKPVRDLSRGHNQVQNKEGTHKQKQPQECQCRCKSKGKTVSNDKKKVEYQEQVFLIIYFKYLRKLFQNFERLVRIKNIDNNLLLQVVKNHIRECPEFCTQLKKSLKLEINELKMKY